MDRLFFARISDKPGEVVEYIRKNPTTHRYETVIIFQANEKKFTFTSDSGSICWIAELGKYDASKVKDYPAKTGNPGGYPVERLALVWKHEVAHKVKEFINA